MFPSVWPSSHFGVSASHKCKLFPHIPGCWDLRDRVHSGNVPVPGPAPTLFLQWELGTHGPTSQVPVSWRSKSFLPHSRLWKGSLCTTELVLSAGPSSPQPCFLPWPVWLSFLDGDVFLHVQTLKGCDVLVSDS